VQKEITNKTNDEEEQAKDMEELNQIRIEETKARSMHHY
jgi:hypothetical protein